MAASASSRRQLEAARQPLNTALALNSEETGTLTLLAEVALALGDSDGADQNFRHVCRMNARAANAYFLRGYIAWKRHDAKETASMLARVREARGPDWKPAGAALEGDVRQRMFSEAGFLGVFEQQWDGATDASHAYAALDAYLRRFR